MQRSLSVMMVCALIPAGALAAPTNQVHALRQQVAALQLDHALDLTQQQAQSLLPLLQDAKAKVAAAKAQRASAEPALVAALTQAVADIKASGAVSPSTAQAVQAARGQAPGALRQDMASFWQQAKQVLTADQLQAMRTVKLGIGQPARADASGETSQPKGHHPFGRRFRVMHALLSDAFVSLVQARAG